MEKDEMVADRLAARVGLSGRWNWMAIWPSRSAKRFGANQAVPRP